MSNKGFTLGNNGFNSEQFEPSAGRPLLAAGRYLFRIVGSDVAKSFDQQTIWADFSLEVANGEHAGAEAGLRITLHSHNQQAIDIGMRKLSSLCHAVGVRQFTHSSQLHGGVFMANVVVETFNDKQTGEARKKNEITTLFYADGSSIERGRYGIFGSTGGFSEGVPAHAAAHVPAPVAPAPSAPAPTYPQSVPAPVPSPVAPAPQQHAYQQPQQPAPAAPQQPPAPPSPPAPAYPTPPAPPAPVAAAPASPVAQGFGGVQPPAHAGFAPPAQG